METEIKKEYGLGRVFVPDERDKSFPMMAALPPQTTARTFKYWNAEAHWGNQGETPQCVGYSWYHWVKDAPITYKSQLDVNAEIIYNEAKERDEWQGSNYDGTSVRAGAKYLLEKGYIKEYRWAWDVQTMALAVLNVSPVVVGTNWTGDMFEPDFDGRIRPTGAVVGGHAYKVDGVNMKTKLFRIKNSWGRSWGNKGFAYISFEDFETLLRNYGECCLAIESKKV